MTSENLPAESVHGQGSAADPSTIAIITVTYNPDIVVLEKQLAQLPAQALKVLVDNASSPMLLDRVRALAAGRSDIRLLENKVNEGLAKALNQGARIAQAANPECRFLLLLDQDTEPGQGGVEALAGAFQRLAATNPRLGCVGPRLLDANTGLEHGFHQISGWRWVRRFPRDDQPVPVANLNGSGTFVSVETFNRVGGLSDDFFIDHVDTDWAFRVQACGYELFGLPGICFRHRMGVTGIRFWCLGWRVWPYRSPGRHYYLFRNTVRLLRQPQVPLVWKAWAPAKLMITFFVHLTVDPDRRAQVGQMVRGFRAGLSQERIP